MFFASSYQVSMPEPPSTMKQLLKSLSPKHVFHGLKKSRSVSKSHPPSFSSTSSFDSSSSDSSLRAGPKSKRAAAPPPRSRSDEWSSSDGDADLIKFDFVQAFRMIDHDGDGKITRVELESLLRRIGGKVSDEELAEMIGEIDRDGDGCISLEELETVGSVLEVAGAGEDDLREAFDFFDADHDGKITAEELRAVFVALGDERCTLEDCRRMIEGVDNNRDGFVCFADFARMMDLHQR
ncbi:hypothetical protein Cgig2_007130 [Carnegiea gigantea]|uniref:EF-hand domain-containing protein n=1 Tax=Carnegiea gigantea TaxID=171969 RepID=A0A9Q1JXH7_9CARY|nr:hypothetical protein Cgig2_007130 [Carnegiea gigantea]